MSVVSMKQLLEAGVHFGHQTRRWNPKMEEYIYTKRNDIYIIDLQKTQELINTCYKEMFNIAKDGGRVMFVGTKKQAQHSVRDQATRSEQFYVDQRWLGGTLTNFKTIKKRIKRLHDIQKMSEDGTFDLLPKKEVVNLRKELEKLEKFLGGIKEMKELPDAIFVVDPRKERIAVQEARKLHIPVFGIVDTNCDPDEVDHIIPANDDAIRAVKLILTVMANAVVEANGGKAEKLPEGSKNNNRRDNNRRDHRGNNRNYNNRDNNRSRDNRSSNNRDSRPNNNTRDNRPNNRDNKSSQNKVVGKEETTKKSAE